MTNRIIPLLVLCTLFYLPCQSQWTWLNPSVLEQNVRTLSTNSDLNWYGTGTKVVSHQDQTFVDFDILDSGLEISRAFPISIDASLESTIWISTTSRVVELNPLNQSWKVHNPSMIDNVSSGVTDIKVISEDEIWWCFRGLYAYDGIDWKTHLFYEPDLNMNVNNPTEIKVGPNNRKWISTNTSTCLHDTCYTPAGLVVISELDTLFFDGNNYGFYDANTTDIEFKPDGTPVLIISGRNSNYIKEYADETWETVTEIPHEGFIFDTEMDCEGRILVAFKDFIAVYSENDWSQILVDTNEMNQIYDIELTDNNELFIGGFKGMNSWDDDAYGVVGITNVDCSTTSIMYTRKKEHCNLNYVLNEREFILNKNTVGPISLSVYNYQGQLILKSSDSKIEFDNINNGMYFIYVETESCNSVIKTVKVK